MRVGLVGCGFIGRRRAEVIRRSETDRLVILADVDRARAEALAREMGSRVSGNWQDVVSADLDAVIVSTTNDWLAPVSRAALEAGRHVLAEKPLARTSAEAAEVAETATGRGVVLKVGFNHRHHPAVRRAHSLVGEGAVGNLLFARARYGHGGRPGYEQEWRMDPRISGGGELLDQGIHVLDLLRWFFGEFIEAFGFTATYVWGSEGLPANERPRIEDNAFALLRTARGQVASLHATWTQWKNLFCLELFGDRGYLIVEGLGGSYGPERLAIGQRRLEGGTPIEETVTFWAEDDSWTEEWRAFRQAVHERISPPGNGHDGVQALRLVEAVYESARSGRVVRL
jgi:predicted dehydrogenase